MNAERETTNSPGPARKLGAISFSLLAALVAAAGLTEECAL